jgi:hypothetical protein
VEVIISYSIYDTSTLLVELEVCARERVNRLHCFEREPMPESAE